MSTDPYTMEVRLCDDRGLVSDERVEAGSPGTRLAPDLTYRKMLNNLRALNGNPDARVPYEGEPFVCTGSAHAAGEHIRCTSPAHQMPVTDLHSARVALANSAHSAIEFSGMSRQEIDGLRREFERT